MKKRKMLVFTYRDLSKTGGVETYLKNFITYLDYDKFDLTLLMPESNVNKSLLTYPIKLVEYRRVTSRPKISIKFLNPFSRLINLYKNTKDILLKENPDIIITIEYITPIVSRWSLKKIPIILIPGSLANLDMIYNNYEYGFRTKLLNNLSRYSVMILEYLSTICSTKIVVSSERLRNSIHKIYKTKIDKIDKIPIGIDLKKFSPKTEPNENYKGKKIILSVSRLTKSKNIRMITDIAEFLDDSYLWIVIGDGEEFDIINAKINEKQLQNKILLLGEKSSPSEYYDLCDVFVHLSYYENFGLVLLEAMAYGKPPIVLNPKASGVNTASDEIIQDGYNGYFVENDPQKIAEKIIEVSKIGNIISDNCIRTVKEKYTFERHLQGLYKLIDNII